MLRFLALRRKAYDDSALRASDRTRRKQCVDDFEPHEQNRMLRQRSLRVRAFSFVLLLLAGAADAQRAPLKSVPLSLTERAAKLAEDGVTHGSARAVMAAGEILRVVELGSARVQRVGAPTGPMGPWDGPMTSAVLFRLASRMASEHGDMATTSYIAWLSQLPDSVPAIRGAAGGPVWADTYLGRGQEAVYSIDFTGGQTPNSLTVSAGSGSAVFECALLEGEKSGSVTARVRSLGGTCSLEWRQSKAGRMTLRIRNAGTKTYLIVSSN